MLPLRDENPTRRTPIVTMAIMAACVGVFFFVQPEDATSDGVTFTFRYAAIPCELIENRPLSNAEVSRTLIEGDVTACDTTSRTPTGNLETFPHKHVWLAVLLSMFLHGGLLHLGGNMLFLWVFGNNVEDHLGRFRFALFYLAGGAAATAAHVLVQLDSTVPVIGASGAIAATMGAYLVWFPMARVRTIILLFVIPVWPRLPAAIPLVVWFISQFAIEPNDGVAWVAHVGGFVFGAAVALWVRSSGGVRQVMWQDKYLAAGHQGGWDNRSGPR